MKKLLAILLLIFLFACSASSQWIWQQKPMLGEQINRAHQLGDPIAAWFFLEGSGNKVFDLSGNGNTGTLQADTHFVPGKFGSALDFDGTGDYVIVTSPSGVSNLSGYTVIVWFKLSAGAATEELFSNTDDSIILRIASSVPTFYHREAGGGYQSDTTTDSISSPGDWHQFDGVWNGTQIESFIDGVGSGSPTGATSLFTVGDLLFGIHSGKVSNPLAGLIDHVMIFNRALSASEVALLYREPFCMFVKDDIALTNAGIPTGVIVTPYYYRALVPLPLIFFTVYCYRRGRKCAA